MTKATPAEAIIPVISKFLTGIESSSETLLEVHDEKNEREEKVDKKDDVPQHIHNIFCGQHRVY